ncbi:MAG: hypothetical protein P4L86_24315 [Mycobacterium sp.]|nr:hypothetical protein [Mycobacterium sp.]
MQIAGRSYFAATAGMAGVSMIALSPLAPPLPGIHSAALPAVSTAAVRLTADFNPIQPWIDGFNQAAAGASTIGSTWAQAPGGPTWSAPSSTASR